MSMLIRTTIHNGAGLMNYVLLKVDVTRLVGLTAQTTRLLDRTIFVLCRAANGASFMAAYVVMQLLHEPYFIRRISAV